MNENKEKCIHVCNKLLRGERSAVETYDIVIEKFRSEPNIGELRSIRDEHMESVLALEENVRSMAGEPSTDSGAWGSVVNVIQHTANLFGEGAALGSLKSGEEHGRDDYEDALNNDDVMIGCKELIQAELLPRIRRHIVVLERLGSVVS